MIGAADHGKFDIGGKDLRTEKPYPDEELDVMEPDQPPTYEDHAPLSAHELSVFIDELADLLYSASSIPLTSKAIVDREQCLETLEVLRANMPWEMLEAKRILSEEEQVLERAEAEAEEIRQLAERQAAFILDQSQLAKAAETRAQETIDAAEREAARVLRMAEKDAEDLYRSLEGELDMLVQDIKALMAARLKDFGESLEREIRN